MCGCLALAFGRVYGTTNAVQGSWHMFSVGLINDSGKYSLVCLHVPVSLSRIRNSINVHMKAYLHCVFCTKFSTDSLCLINHCLTVKSNKLYEPLIWRRHKWRPFSDEGQLVRICNVIFCLSFFLSNSWNSLFSFFF